MSSKLDLTAFLIAIAAAFESATAEDYTVGDDQGWTNPPNGAAASSAWPSKKEFEVGDIIVFNWTGTHNVAEVSTVATNPMVKSDKSSQPL